MTRFWRNGFYRTNAYGTVSWVEGHWVERDNWDKWSYFSSDYFRRQLRDCRADSSNTSQFINPNVNCPICSKPVFFYRNSHGSRVFFDELGPPWPKHCCMDFVSGFVENQKPDLEIAPVFRDQFEILEILKMVSYSGLDLENDFEVSFGTKPWVPTIVADRFKCRTGVFFVLQNLIDSKQKIFLFQKEFSKSMVPGSIAFFKKGRLSFFEVNSFQSVEVKPRRIKNASQFLDELIQARNPNVFEQPL
jgi:hypothetical protein